MFNSLFYLSSFRWSFALSLLAWTCMHAWLVTLFGFGWPAAFTDAAVSSLGLAAACWMVSNTLRFYLPRQNRVFFILSLVSFATLLQALLSWAVLLLPMPEAFTSFFASSMPVRATFAFLIIGGIALMNILWANVQQQEADSQRNAEVQKLATEAELYRIREQLKPHFLFNSLNSIQALIGSEPRRARLMVQQLSDFLRSTIRRDENQWIPLAQELEILQLYLEIEKVRFGHRLQVEVAVPEQAAALQLPALLLQPVVENAIKFGLYDTLEAVTITIEAQQQEHNLVVTISNPYDAHTSAGRKGTGYGLASVQRRLDLLFHRKDLLVTRREPSIFTTIITIPQPV